MTVHNNVYLQDMTIHNKAWVQQAAEQESLDQVAGFQRSLEAFSEGILLVDTSTPDWNVLFQNEAWLRITGMSRDEVYGSKMWQLFTPAGQSKVHCVHAFCLLASFEEGLVHMCIDKFWTAGCQLLALTLTCFLPCKC